MRMSPQRGLSRNQTCCYHHFDLLSSLTGKCLFFVVDAIQAAVFENLWGTNTYLENNALLLVRVFS